MLAPTTPLLLIHEACPLLITHLSGSSNFSIHEAKTIQAQDYACRWEKQHQNEVWSTLGISQLARAPDLHAVWSPKVIFFHIVQ
jgi:hypothetical protein